jgi:hypothetical protein
MTDKQRRVIKTHAATGGLFCAVLVIFSMPAMLACGPHPWRDYHSALEVLARTVTDIDAGLADVAVENSDAAIEAVVAEASAAAEAYRTCTAAGRTDCGPEPTVAEFLARYHERVAAWQRVTLALDEIRQALLLAEDAAEIWRDRQERPADIDAVCEQVSDAYEHLRVALEPIIPQERVNRILQQAQIAIEPVCSFIGGQVTR